MKKILSLIVVALFISAISFGQAPGIFNYQGVARNSVGNVLQNKNITLRLTVHDGSPTGTVVYSETRNVTTNNFGLFNVQVGSAGAGSVTGTVAGVPWAVGSKYIQVEIDPDGGSSFINIGTAQLASVPYSLNAASAAPIGIASGDLSGTYPAPIVARLQGRTVSAAVPATNDFLRWNGTSWTPTSVSASGAITGSGTLNFLPKFTPSGTVLGNSLLFDDGLNVGIGNNTPSYRLDVEHGGGTGARIRSSSSYSILDIDAASGDAALRFANNGVNQWNIRNRPADDYYEIFELGGGGSRFVIQDGTGNVGIGETTNPIYKLDVLHGGGTGARIRSSSSYSILDIDAASGDAALRFANNGVNQWNIRNQPGSDNLQIFELGGGGERMRIENTTGKVVVNGDFTVLGTKMFTMDHPLDPANKLLRHAAAESNEVINIYSGNATTDATGKVTVQLPDYFEALNKDFRYQLTVIGAFAQAIISKEVKNNQFEIATSIPNVKVSWEVKGVRNDPRMKQHPFKAEEEKSAAQKGKYWDPAAYNQPASMGVTYDGAIESSLNNPKPVPTKAAPATTGGSLDQPAVQKIITRPMDTDGSVAPTEIKKAEAAKAVDTKGTSVEDTVKPAAEETKTKKSKKEFAEPKNN